MAKTVRAKRVRRQQVKATPTRVVVEADEIDEYDEAAVKAMVEKTPEVRFRHASCFTDDEDKIIAASLKQRIQLYKVAASLKCSYNTLKKHIDGTKVLADIAKEAREIECGELREAVDDLVRMRHPAVVMWRAKQLMPNEYGESMEAEEDDTRIIIGAIPEELIMEGDRKLLEASEKPPEVGLTAMLDKRVLKNSDSGEDQKEIVAMDERKQTEEKVEKVKSEPEAESREVVVQEEAFTDDGFDPDAGFEDFNGGSDLGF